MFVRGGVNFQPWTPFPICYFLLPFSFLFRCVGSKHGHPRRYGLQTELLEKALFFFHRFSVFLFLPTPSSFPGICNMYHYFSMRHITCRISVSAFSITHLFCLLARLIACLLKGKCKLCCHANISWMKLCFVKSCSSQRQLDALHFTRVGLSNRITHWA